MATIMDGYIRVSQRGDRDGESYRSPEIQRDEIQRWANNNGVTIGKIVVDEDVSGAKPVEERGLGELIRRAEEGVSGGVVVYRADRFARDMAETAVAVRRLKEVDARLVGVADGVDSDQPNGKVVLNIMATMAEVYLDGIKQGWKATTDSAVAGGIHIACRAPFGYLRADQVAPHYDAKGELIRDGRLVVDPDTAPTVKRAFEMKAEGVSLGKIRSYIIEAAGRGIAKSTVSGMLKNRVYLGEARGPNGAVNADAHDAIVDEKLFAKVRGTAGVYQPRDGSIAEQALLSGLITCESCGHKLRVIGSTNPKTKEREASYVCAGKYASGDCEAPAAAKAKLVDELVTTMLREDDEAVASSALSAEQEYLVAREAVRKAEEGLDAWVDDPAIASSLGKERFQRGLLKRQDALDEARRRMWDLDDIAGLDEDDDSPIVWIDGKPHVYEVWGENMERDRKTVRRFVASVTLDKADPARRRWQPISERVKVRWVGAS